MKQKDRCLPLEVVNGLGWKYPGESDTESQDHEAIPGKRKRPHARRAHWHHYRVGKGKKDLILKWTPPTFINADLLEDGDTPAVIHSVKE